MSVQTIHFLSHPPPKKSTHQHLLNAKNPHENNKNQAKMLKMYGKNVDFHNPPLSHRKVYVSYTCDNPYIFSYLAKYLRIRK